MVLEQDRNFDSLIHQFERRIYATDKGDWRLKLVKEDLGFLIGREPLSIWDAGCGFAQISQWLAEQGHRLTLCDVSGKMLERARENFARSGLEGEFHHRSAQSLAKEPANYDVVLLHAVLEWMADPTAGLRTIRRRVKEGGYLSLLFYNRNAMVYSNTLKGGWRLKNLLNDSYLGQGSKLTPPNPQFPHEIVADLERAGFEIVKHTGIRVFYDYLSPETLSQTDRGQLFELEYRYCRLPAYRDMGRYVHLLCRRR